MINTYNETMLHYRLKEWYALEENGKTEQVVDSFICDSIAESGEIIEIQTKNLSALKPKLEHLLKTYQVRIVHPIAKQTIIRKYDESGNLISQRKSPKKGTIYTIFRELTGIYPFLLHSHFRLEVVFITQSEIRVPVSCASSNLAQQSLKRRRRVKEYVTQDRLLECIEGSHVFSSVDNYRALLPYTDSDTFTVQDVQKTHIGKNASIMLWVLNKIDIIEVIAKKGRKYVYALKKNTN